MTISEGAYFLVNKHKPNKVFYYHGSSQSNPPSLHHSQLSTLFSEVGIFEIFSGGLFSIKIKDEYATIRKGNLGWTTNGSTGTKVDEYRYWRVNKQSHGWYHIRNTKSNLLLEYIPNGVDRVECLRTDGTDDQMLWKLVQVPSFSELK